MCKLEKNVSEITLAATYFIISALRAGVARWYSSSSKPSLLLSSASDAFVNAELDLCTRGS